MFFVPSKITSLKSRTQDGFSIIEILVAVVIISSIGIMSILSIQLYIRMSARNSINMQSALLIEETSEILLFLRDLSWEENIAPLEIGVDYFLLWENGTFSIVTEEVQNNNLTRSFSLSEVIRDSDDRISGTGTIDPDSFIVDINVSWDNRGEIMTQNAQMLIHNTYAN